MGLKENIDLLGAVIAITNNLLLTGIFLARIFRLKKTEFWLGIIFILSIVPIFFIVFNSFEFNRSLLYYFQLILIICFIITELFLDYILKINFRNNNKILIPYITLFYASTGGMIGVAGQSGQPWITITIITFLIMVTFSLLMHFKTKTD